MARFISFCVTLVFSLTSKPSLRSAAAMSRASLTGFFSGASLYAALPMTSAMRFSARVGDSMARCDSAAEAKLRQLISRRSQIFFHEERIHCLGGCRN
jgi:hypothetical protein